MRPGPLSPLPSLREDQGQLELLLLHPCWRSVFPPPSPLEHGATMTSGELFAVSCQGLEARREMDFLGMTVPVTHGHFGPGGEVFCTCGLLEAVQESLEDGVIPGLSLPSNTQPGDSRMRAWISGLGRQMPRAGPGGTAGQKAASVHERKSTSS
ncbi:unnamed protein product [Rangifer tarandus platyrhynchus]|uniref:Uncharacterized protein n=1 Tax=Rangifer tarandus platyrhynchus TaxID=3082113 RepID=A0AC59ZRU1_RANTA